MVKSPNRRTSLDGLRLATSLHVKLSGGASGQEPSLSISSQLFRFWVERSEENASLYKKHIIKAAGSREPGMMITALVNRLLKTRQALEALHDLTWLMRNQSMHIFDITWSAVITEFDALLGLAEDTLPAIGKYLVDHPRTPWITQPPDHWNRYDWDSSEKDPQLPESADDPYSYLGGAAILLISSESDPSILDRHLAGDYSRLTPFDDLEPYIQRRRNAGTENPLPDLPVPDIFKQVFKDWAAGKIDLIASDTDAPEDGK
jgi:hypothetical protein